MGGMSTCLLVMVTALVWGSASAATMLYGMVRVGQSPNMYQLSTVDPLSGLIATVGNETARSELPGGPTSGLSAIYNNVFYFLGDNSYGTPKVVGLRVKDSTEVCSVEIPELAEVGAVGAGQTLDVDYGSGNLIATGPGSATADKKTHIAFTIDPVQCTYTRLEEVTYGDADAFPLCHGNTLNYGYLYTTVQDSESGNYGVEAVDISGKEDATMVVEYTDKAIWGLNWLQDDDDEYGTLVGIALDSSDSLVIDGITGIGNPGMVTWTTVDTSTTKSYNELWGNGGAVSCMGGTPGVSDHLYVLASRGPGDVTGVDILCLCPVYGTEISVAPLHGEAYDLYGAACIYSLEALEV